MPRKQRIHYTGALYHVMVRGNNGENVLSDEIKKGEYLKILSHYKKQFCFKLFAFCIMDNHIHLLIGVKDIPLSQIMQRIQQVYTQWFNRMYNRTGHVFQQRYKALLCNKEEYLLQLVKYIHNNPIRANLYDGIKYKWSSHIHYTGIVNDKLVDVDEALGIFSEKKKQALEQYLHFMDQEPEDISYGNSEEFNPKVRKDNQIEKETHCIFNIDEIIEKICILERVSINEIIKKTRIQRISDIRKAIVILSERHCRVSSTMLAKKLNLPISMVSKIKSGVSKGTDYVQEVIQRFAEISE